MTSISINVNEFLFPEILSRFTTINRENVVIKPKSKSKSKPKPKPNRQSTLPSSSELPDSDEVPVDNELQTLVPSLLHDILAEYWSGRSDWFFGVNMGIYHTTSANPKIPIVPDGFLSLGVKRWKKPYGRSSYVVWEENNLVPSLVLEFVSKTYGGEYDKKMIDYARLNVLYYVVFNPQYHKRHRRAPLEVYRLEKGKYMRQLGEPIWMPEIGLGIGRYQGIYKQRLCSWLYWYDKNKNRLPTPTEKRLQAEQEKLQAEQEAVVERRQRLQAEQEKLQAEQEAMAERRQKKQAQRDTLLAEQYAEQDRQRASLAEQRAEKMAKLLREMGVDPNEFG